MRKIILYIAASLDGYIARKDGSLDWLNEFPNPSGEDYGYRELLGSIDTILMGNGTYKEIVSYEVGWPYADKQTYVFTRFDNNLSPQPNVRYITNNHTRFIQKLKRDKGKDIWLVGGGEIISSLLQARLIDEIQICYIPVTIGDGIPLFPSHLKESKWKLQSHISFDSGIIKLSYCLEV